MIIVGFRRIGDADVTGKKVIVRVDLNSPISPETGLVIDNRRFEAHAETLRRLAERGAKIIVLAHQGRKGEPEFTTLEEHSKLLTRHVGRKVSYVPDLIGARAEDAIKSMSSGDIILLGNLRELDEESLEKTPEEHSESALVRKLSSLADLYVLDAFSVAHRSHASVVGFSRVLPSYAGEVMAKELDALGSIDASKGKVILLMGGNKPEECTSVIDAYLSRESPRLDRVLACGVLGDMFLRVFGHNLGEATEQYLEKKGLWKERGKIEQLAERLGDRLVTPTDLAFEKEGKRNEITVEALPASGMILDIGRKTAENYGKIIADASKDFSIILKGTPGVYEKSEFRLGSKMIYESLAKSPAFTLIGGGDSSTALQVLGIDIKEYSYVSLGGGALIRYLAGKPMPGVEALSAQRVAVRGRQSGKEVA